MKKHQVMIVGFGNVGRGVKYALEQSEDLKLAGIVSRSPERVAKEVKDIPILHLDDVKGWKSQIRPQVAILCGGSKDDLPRQGPFFARYVNTVDSFDNHSRIPQYFAKMNQAAKRSGRVAVISTGWDPGIFSLERVLANSFLPGTKPYGFYGLGEKGGLSMGHSDALRTIDGVADARQYTHAVPQAIDQVRAGKNPIFEPGDMHTRECFVVLKPGADAGKIEKIIKSMPGYFAPYKTTVNFISQAELDNSFAAFPHDGLVAAASTTGQGKNQALIEYRCSWGSNPEATANVLVAHARAALRMAKAGNKGAFTILDIPPAYFNPAKRKELIANFM